jgi:hypothetical protein
MVSHANILRQFSLRGDPPAARNVGELHCSVSQRLNKEKRLAEIQASLEFRKQPNAKRSMQAPVFRPWLDLEPGAGRDAAQAAAPWPAQAAPPEEEVALSLEGVCLP